MPRNIEMRRLIDRSLKLEMTPLGFTRERGKMYRLKEVGNISGVASFTAKLYRDLEWQYSPNVGARHEGVNRQLYELSDDLADNERSLNLLVAHILTNIGYLMPERKYKQWSFPLEGSIDPTLDDMIHSIKAYGIPFIDMHTRQDVFRATLAKGTYTIANNDEYLPTLFVVEGKYDLAETSLNEALAKRSARFDPEARWYRDFAMKLQKIIDIRRNGSIEDARDDQH